MEVIVKNPAKDLHPFIPALRAKVPYEANFDARESKNPDLFDSDLHGGNGAMMTAVYGSDFQKVWKKTRKKWWS